MDDFTDKSHILPTDGNSDDEDDVPLGNLIKRRKDERQQTRPSTDQTISSEAPQTQHDVLDSSDDEDDVPLVNLLKNPKVGKQPQMTRDQTLSSEAPQTQNEERSSDEGPLTERTKKATENQNQLKGRRTKKTLVLDSSDDEDDVPLVNLLMKPKEEKLSEKTGGQTLSSEAPQTQRGDDSSEDEPLSKFRKPLPAKETEVDPIRTKSRRRAYKRTVSSSDDSDSEPGKRTKSPSARRPSSKSVKTTPQTKPEPQRPRSSDGSSDDDLPLVNLIRKQEQTTTKIKNQNKTRMKTTPAQMSASKPTARTNKTHVSSSDDSDSEPGKRTKSPSARRPSSKSMKTTPQTKPEPQRPRSSDGSSEDDLPLVNLIRKQEQTTTTDKNKTRIKTTPAQMSASKPTARTNKTHVIAAESSDEEPLSHLLKKIKGAVNSSAPHGDNMRPKKRGQTPTKNHKGPSGKVTVTANKKRQSACKKGPLSDSSGDELKVAKHPHVTMLLKVMVERC